MVSEELSPTVLADLSGAALCRLASVSTWDLSDVRARVERRLGWSDEQVDEALREYRKFIMLISLRPDAAYGMAEAVDEVWHQHILDTLDYAAMCEAAVGGMIHHVQTPLDRRADLSAPLRLTLRQLERTFIGAVSGLWSGNAHASAKCCGHIVATA